MVRTNPRVVGHVGQGIDRAVGPARGFPMHRLAIGAVVGTMTMILAVLHCSERGALLGVGRADSVAREAERREGSP